jgi:hypothetical protein
MTHAVPNFEWLKYEREKSKEAGYCNNVAVRCTGAARLTATSSQYRLKLIRGYTSRKVGVVSIKHTRQNGSKRKATS